MIKSFIEWSEERTHWFLIASILLVVLQFVVPWVIFAWVYVFPYYCYLHGRCTKKTEMTEERRFYSAY